jgi:hypothetical protein
MELDTLLPVLASLKRDASAQAGVPVPQKRGIPRFNLPRMRRLGLINSMFCH